MKMLIYMYELTYFELLNKCFIVQNDLLQPQWKHSPVAWRNESQYSWACGNMSTQIPFLIKWSNNFHPSCQYGSYLLNNYLVNLYTLRLLFSTETFFHSLTFVLAHFCHQLLIRISSYKKLRIKEILTHITHLPNCRKNLCSVLQFHAKS